MDLYSFSNSVENVCLSRFSHTQYHNLLESTTSIEMRYKYAKALLDYLCDKFNIPHCNLQVLNRNRPQRGRTQIYGDYTPHTFRIRIWNLTSKTNKPIAIKTFTETLIHEFIHHYDIEKLKMETSIHTKGFYMRITDLMNKLK